MTVANTEKQNARWRAYYYRHPEFHRARRVASQKRNSAFVDSLKSPCVRCGIADTRVIDFHHTRNKINSVASLRVAGWKESRIRAEIEKCICICANCHRILHWEERLASYDS